MSASVQSSGSEFKVISNSYYFNLIIYFSYNVTEMTIVCLSHFQIPFGSWFSLFHFLNFALLQRWYFSLTSWNTVGFLKRELSPKAYPKTPKFLVIFGSDYNYGLLYQGQSTKFARLQLKGKWLICLSKIRTSLKLLLHTMNAASRQHH